VSDLSIILLWIAAIIIAIEQALMNAPKLSAQLPRVLASKNWNYVPLALLIVWGSIQIARLFIPVVRPEISLFTSQPSPTPTETPGRIVADLHPHLFMPRCVGIRNFKLRISIWESG
jgi:hypothetical protein